MEWSLKVMGFGKYDVDTLISENFGAQYFRYESKRLG